MSLSLLSFTLPVAELFTSTDADPPMTFVRSASPYDTDYYHMDLVKLSSFIPPHIRHVCISGGDRFIHNEGLGVFLAELSFQDVIIHFETSGTIDPPEFWKSNDHIHWSFTK